MKITEEKNPKVGKLIKSLQVEKYLSTNLCQKINKIEKIELKEISIKDRLMYKSTKAYQETNSLAIAHRIRCKNHGIILQNDVGVLDQGGELLN